VVATGEGESTSELPLETLVESSEDGLDEPQVAAEAMVQSVDLTEDAAVTDQVQTEAVHESLTETVEMEEMLVPEMVEQFEQLTVTTAETVVIADEQTFQGEQLTNDAGDTTISIEQIPVDTITELGPVPGTVAAPINVRDQVLGVEVILAMGALGTGLAWFYTRRRAG
jgi:hypothetical protein